MKLLLINPSRWKQGNRDFWDPNIIIKGLGICASIPLWATTLAALTPKGIEIKVVDENIEEIDYDEEADLVGISAFTAFAPRAYAIADEFRKKGVKVALGGIHASMLPEEAAQHADAVIIGEAENTWKQVVCDFTNNKLEKYYKSSLYPDLEESPPPRLDLLQNNRYFLNLIQTSRGCPFDCNFCTVKRFLGGELRTKSIEQVINEIAAFPKEFEVEIFGYRLKLGKGLLFADDNIVGNINFARKLFEKLKTLNLPKWWCQASINIGKDLELLALMQEAGCKMIFIGIESLDEKSLDEMGKKINRVEEYEKCIKTIQSFGISVFASFILGNDNENESIFQKTVDFINKNNIVYNMINILIPLPDTRLFNKMEAEGRILHKNWDKYNGGSVCFKPKKMSAKALEDGYRWVYKELYSPATISKRIKRIWKEGTIKNDAYKDEFTNGKFTDKLFYALLILKILFLSKGNGIKLSLNLLPEILKGKGELETILHALIYIEFAGIQ